MEGLTLKQWQLGEKLGSGACSDVYAVTSLSSDTDRQYVMKLSPLPQLPAAKLKNKKRKKTPAERNADALYAEHLLYKNHLRDQPGIPYGYRFIVIERLGRTLETVLQEQGPVPSETAARLGQEILETLQQMHVKNILYVDVKPENFMLNMGKENKVYCVDFGISDRYVTATGKHKELKEGTVVGTPTFLSIHCHNGLSTFRLLCVSRMIGFLLYVSAASSRRDDVESLLYVLIYLIRGDLPWQCASSDAEGARIKSATSVDQLCASLPKAWGTMLTRIRACGFENRPDYDFFEQQFSMLGGKKGLNTPFKWGTRKIGKAVGALITARRKTMLTAELTSSQASAVNSPIRKRVKSADEVLPAPLPAVTKTKKTAKAKTTSRSNSKAISKQVAASDIKRTTKKDVTVEPMHASNDREVFKAIAGHAAATAAIKRYNLRSAHQD
uniref:Casein kinase I n=1 Tax=Hyaloperonospora arabidopsidis (strain Emoy2) TaxID=559515 RepID=M4BBB7_HYAAE